MLVPSPFILPPMYFDTFQRQIQSFGAIFNLSYENAFISRITETIMLFLQTLNILFIFSAVKNEYETHLQKFTLSIRSQYPTLRDFTNKLSIHSKAPPPVPGVVSDNLYFSLVRLSWASFISLTISEKKSFCHHYFSLLYQFHFLEIAEFTLFNSLLFTLFTTDVIQQQSVHM